MDTDKAPVIKRQILSFVRREGRITTAQMRALADLLPVHGLDREGALLDFDRVFARRAPRLVEIGCGAGECLVHMAACHPENDYLGIEIYRPGVGRLLRGIEAGGLSNVKIWCASAEEVFAARIPPASVEGIFMFFPDPWPKRRHHKRRLIRDRTLRLLHSRLLPHGRLYLATDWADYAAQMLRLCEGSGDWVNLSGTGHSAPRLRARPITRFEARALAEGRQIFDFVFARS